MARFLDSTKSVNKEAGRSKGRGRGRKGTTQKAKSPSVSQRAQETNDRLSQKYGGGSTRSSSSSSRGRSQSQQDTRQNLPTRRYQNTMQSTNPRMLDSPTNQRRYVAPETTNGGSQGRRNQQFLEEERRRKQREAEERRKAAQRQKSGMNSMASAEERETARRMARNTPGVVKESAKQVAIGYGKTLADVTEQNNSAAIGSKIDIKSKEFQEDIERRRKKSTQKSREAFKSLSGMQDRSEAAVEERTSEAKGFEKAYYGALESGTGMLADRALGPAWAVSMFARTYGNMRGKAQAEGATESEDRANALLQAAKETATEYMFMGAGLAKGLSGRWTLAPAEKLANLATRNMKGPLADVTHSAIRLLGGVGEENLEEAAAWGVEPLIEEYTYKRNVRARKKQATKDSLKAQSDDLRNSIESEEQAEAIAAYLNSPDFIEQNVQTYKDTGMSEQDARELAESMRDYLAATLSGDSDTMADIEERLGTKFAGEGLSRKDWSISELMDTFAATTLLTGATGLPGAASTAMRGSAIRDQLGNDGVRALADTAIDFEDKTASLKAQAMRDRMDSGKDITSTQAYDLMQATREQYAKDQNRQDAAYRTARNTMDSERLVTPYQQERDGFISLDEVTSEAYQASERSARQAISAVLEGDEQASLTDAKIDRGSKAIAGFQTGVFTVDDANELNYRNTAVRTAFEEVTGVDLSQYVVKGKDGEVDIPATNTATKEALFAMAADNMVKSAQAETANWMDNVKGEVVTQITQRMGSQGAIALQQALDDVDERDRAKYMTTANATDMLYHAAREMGTDWENVKGYATRMYKNISEEKLKAMYDAGLADRDMASDKARGAQIAIGEAISEVSQESAPMGQLVIETETPVKGTVARVFSELADNLGVDIHLVDKFVDKDGKVLKNVNGEYRDGVIYINVNSSFEQNVGYIFMHEVTHHLKMFAPEQYNELENLVREKWFNYDASQMQSEIAKKIELYAAHGQTLTEEQALEEIIADAAHEFINDPNFAQQVAEENPSLAKAMLNSIRNALRMLRRVLATGSIEDETHMNTLFSQLGILDEAERLWLNAYTQAVANKAAVGIEDLQNRIYEEGREKNLNLIEQNSNATRYSIAEENSIAPEKQERIVREIGPDIRFSITTFKDDKAKGKFIASLNGGKGGFAGLSQIASGKTILRNTMLNNGYSEAQANVATGFLEHMADYLESDEVQMNYGFIGWDDLSNAEVSVRSDKDGNIVSVAVSAMVVNGEYPVNFDMTTICNKREGVMEVIQELTRKYDADTGKTVLNSIKLTDEKMWSINKALKAEGIDTACLGCFVEARRYYTNKFIDKIDDVWNSAVREARRKLGLPEEEYFNFAKGKKVSGEDYNQVADLWTAYDESTESKRSPSQRIKILMNEIVKNKEVDSPYLKLISAEDILTPEGIRGFKELSTHNKDRDMVKMIKSIYGTSAPKEILAFTPYNSEIALLPNKIKGVETGDYLKSIGGTRVQSFSDFKMEHFFDHMQMVADEAARGFVNHGYSKVIAYPRLFGLTGRKINMSVMFDVLPASAWQEAIGCSESVAAELAERYQGLRFVKEKPKKNEDNRPYKEVEIEGVHGYLTYLVSDADYVNSVYERLYQENIKAGMSEEEAKRKANTDKPFEQSINYSEAVELENQEGYKENVGIIAVAFGDEHLRMLLDDPNVRYIIPYHRSGLPVFIAQKTALDIARNYTDFQNTNKAKGGYWINPDGTRERMKTKYEKYLAENPTLKYPAIEFFAKEINGKGYSVEFGKKSSKEKGSMAGTASFDVYENLESAKDIREISNAYLEYCIDHNYVPVFHEFAGHKNYYKMLFDFAVTDGTTDHIYPQKPVKNIYPGVNLENVDDINNLTDDDYKDFYKEIERGLSEQNAKTELRRTRLGKVVDEDLLSQTGENSIIADTNVQHIVNGTPDYTSVRYSNEEVAPESMQDDTRRSISANYDEPYMAAVESGNMDEAQRLVDEAARMAGFDTPLLHHGTPSFGFTTFDLARGENIIFATNNRLTAETYSGETSRNRISEKSKVDIDQLYGQGLLDKAKQHLSRYKDYRLMSGSEKEDLLDEARSDMASIANDVVGGFIAEHRDAFDEEKLGIANRIVDSLNRISTAWNDDDVQTAWDDFQDAIWDLKWADESMQLELSREIQSGGALQFLKNRISDFMYAGDLYARGDSTSEYVYDNQLALELGAELNKGIYGLYGNPGKQLVIDANGSNWNQIIPPDELELYGPQRTRSIAEAAKAKGYDSVLFKDLRDNGGATAYNGESDVYMFFNPNQVKSADPVTYAEDGSVIPLSERFDPTNNDIRYSLSTVDSDGNILTNGQMEYFRNSQARDAQGRLVPVYHTTRKGGFTIFDPMRSDDHRSLFFASNFDVSQTYANRADTTFDFDENAKFDTWQDFDKFARETFGLSESDSLAREFDISIRDENGRTPYTLGNSTDAMFKAWLKLAENGDSKARSYTVTMTNPYNGERIQAKSMKSLLSKLERIMVAHGQTSGYYQVYLNLENPLEVDAEGSMWNEIEFEGQRVKTRQLAEIAEERGYDGVIIRNTVDIGNKSELKGEKESDIYIAFSSNQVKDTRNENPSENPDIRYSFTDEDELAAYVNETAESMDEMYYTDPELEEGRVRLGKAKADFVFSRSTKWNQRWLTEGLVLDEKKTRKAVREAVMSVMSKAEGQAKYKNELVNEAMKTCKRAFYLMKIGKFSEAGESIYDLSRKMVEDNNFFDDAYEETFNSYVELRDHIKSMKLYVPDLGAEEYAEHRRNDMGKIWLCSEQKGTPIDEEWDDLCRQWPEWFDINEAKPTNMLYALEHALEAAQPMAKALCSEEAVDYIDSLANQLYDIVYEGEEYQSIADEYKASAEKKTAAMKVRFTEAMQKMQASVDEMKAQHRAEIQNLKARNRQNLRTQKMKYDYEIAELKQNREYNIQRLKAEKQRAVREEKQKNRQRAAERKARAIHKKHFDSITKNYKKLVDRLLTNTKDKNIPEIFKKDLANALAAFDLQTVKSKEAETHTSPADKYGNQYVRIEPSNKTIQMMLLRSQLEKISEETEDFQIRGPIVDLLKRLSDNIDGKTIDELNEAEIADVDDMLKALVHEFNEYKRVTIEGKRQEYGTIASAQIDHCLAHAEAFGQGKDYFGMVGALDNIINMDEVTPAYLFRRIDPERKGIGKMYREIRKSFDKYVRNQAQLNEWMNEILGPYQNSGKAWNKYGADQIAAWRDVRNIQPFNLTNGTISLTPAQMMSLYCLKNRPQAMKHIKGAGVVIAPVSFQAKMHSDVKKRMNRTTPVILNDAEIKLIVGQMTKEQIAVAEKLQQLMVNQMAEWGNEASMDVMGIRLFKEKDYFPIRSDKAALKKELNDTDFVQAIRNFGFAKAVEPKANNAIVIDDIFNVVAEHCNNMNLYNAYSKSMDDFMKVYNFHQVTGEGDTYRDISVEQALSQAFSKKAPKYIMAFLRDLNGNVSGNGTGIEDMMNKALGNAKKAAVFANGRVALQQPTAIARAFVEISPKYLKGIAKNPSKASIKATMDEMFEHCPIALWKSWGYYDINLGKSIEDLMMNEGKWLEDKMTDIYGKLDNITWTAIWQMCKAEVEDKHSDVEKGSDEYWDLVNDRMTDVVDFTQVVDSPMHRSHAMRNKAFYAKLATSFMAEPTLTYNLFRDGFIRTVEAAKMGDKKTAGKVLGKTLAVYVGASALTSAFAAVWDAVRGKKPDGDDDEDDDFLSLWLANFLANMQDDLKIWNKVYYVKDVTSLFDGWDYSNLALNGWKSFSDGFAQLTGYRYVKSKKVWYENLFGGLGTLCGLPFGTLIKDFKAIYHLVGIDVPLFDSLGEFLDEMPERFGGGESSSGSTGKASGKASSGDTTVIPDGKVTKDDKAVVRIGKDEMPIDIKDGSVVDNFLNHFGINLTAAEIAQAKESEEKKKRDKQAEKIRDKYADLDGLARDKKVWSAVTTYIKDNENDGRSLNEFIHDGDYNTVERVKEMYLAAGGDEAYFTERIMATSNTELKKTISADNTPEQIEAQQHIKDYLLANGMTEQDLSDIAYKSYTAKDLKAAIMLNDEQAAVNELRALIQAGLTEDDFYKLWDNRKRFNIKSYKDKGGKYADKFKSTGTYHWPITGTITSGFGHRNSPGGIGSTNHKGLDIAGSMGDPVGASDGGVVTYAGWYGGAGKTVMIQHDDGTVTQYSHLSWWDVHEGDIVGQGQTIGNVGSTGNSTGPHLHFAVMVNGSYVDPTGYLNR